MVENWAGHSSKKGEGICSSCFRYIFMAVGLSGNTTLHGRNTADPTVMWSNSGNRRFPLLPQPKRSWDRKSANSNLESSSYPPPSLPRWLRRASSICSPLLPLRSLYLLASLFSPAPEASQGQSQDLAVNLQSCFKQASSKEDPAALSKVMADNKPRHEPLPYSPFQELGKKLSGE